MILPFSCTSSHKGNSYVAFGVRGVNKYSVSVRVMTINT